MKTTVKEHCYINAVGRHDLVRRLNEQGKFGWVACALSTKTMEMMKGKEVFYHCIMTRDKEVENDE